MEKSLREEIRSKYEGAQFPSPAIEPLWYGRRPDTLVKGKQLIIDKDTQQQYGVCSDGYGLVEHEEVIDIAEKASLKFPEYGKPEIAVKLLKYGGRLQVTILYPEVEFEVRANDTVNPRIEIFNSYDMGWKYGGRFGAFRLVCSNGMTVGKIFSKFAKRHLLSLDTSELAKSIEEGMTLFSDQTKLWTDWAEKRMLNTQYEQLWTSLPFSPKEREYIETLSETQTKLILGNEKEKGKEVTFWDAFSVVTQYVTHEVKSEVRQIEILPEITKAFEKIWNN